MKSVAIVQSNYIPWKGYFDLISSVDELILYDDLQYTRRDWRNRNRIKTSKGAEWLTIPVRVKGRYLQKIRDTVVSDQSWSDRHWKTICLHYSRARHFEEVAPILDSLYRECGKETHLSAINFRFLQAIAEMLGTETRITWSMDYVIAEGRTERLVSLCRQVGAGLYLSGPAAKSYLDEALFAAAGIQVSWMDYSGYPEYEQLFCPPFIHEVSVLDLIANVGLERARDCMLSFGRQIQTPNPVSTGNGSGNHG
ncbi:MAG: WbqC family protein [Deltaproteobacteria bacterium]|nr:WbqC family protein [Deltaproteobacteria bacterium]